MTTVRTATFAELDTRTLYDLLRLRTDVFVVEQRCPYPDLDGRDTEPDTRHLWIDGDDGPVAYLRMLTDRGGDRGGTAGGDHGGGDAVRVGRVVVAKHARGAGLAAELMAVALAQAGDRPCVLDAQAHLVAYYAAFGFTTTGPEFLEDGIAHVPMRRQPGYGSAATSSATERRRPV